MLRVGQRLAHAYNQPPKRYVCGLVIPHECLGAVPRQTAARGRVSWPPRDSLGGARRE